MSESIPCEYQDLGNARPPRQERCGQIIGPNRFLGNRHSETNLLGDLFLAFGDLGDFDRALDYATTQLIVAKQSGAMMK